jgi:hypothetical protein
LTNVVAYISHYIKLIIDINYSPGVSGVSTVTVQVAVFVLSSVDVTVIVAVPSATAVTTPSSTVATLSSLVDQVTVLYVASLGLTVTVSVSVASGANVTSVLFNSTQVTAIFSTLIVANASTAPDFAVTLIFSHSAKPVTTPLETVALVVSLLVRVIGNSNSAGVTLAVNVSVLPILTVQVVGLTKIASGCIGLSLPEIASISSSYISVSQGVSAGHPISTYHSCSSIGLGCFSSEGRFCNP